MSHMIYTAGIARPNFLESEIGLIQKTHTIPASIGVADGARKIVKAGTPFPANDATAIGIVFTDTDVTYGDTEGSVMVAGRVLKDRVTVADAAITALETKGLYFVKAPDVTR